MTLGKGGDRCAHLEGLTHFETNIIILARKTEYRWMLSRGACREVSR